MYYVIIGKFLLVNICSEGYIKGDNFMKAKVMYM